MELNLKNMTGSITLNSGHSLITSHKPEMVTGEVFSKIMSESNKSKLVLEQFGLFETATPNYTTYYPDVGPEDLKPKEEDFIYPIFRALSATVVWKGYRPIDFSKPGVLKDAAPMLIGQTINADHETALGNGMGVVKNVFWQDAYTTDGVKIPAGINAEFMIDGKSNPRIARGIMSNPPIIHSNSVSVQFQWEQSHTNMDRDEFMRKLGTFDEKGSLIRLVVTKIIRFTETSLVAHGADPYAQILNNGKINNPKYAASVYSFSSKDEKGKDIQIPHSFDYKSDLTFELNADTILSKPIINKPDENQLNMDVLEKLAAHFGLDQESLTETNVCDLLDTVIGNKTEDLKTRLSSANSEKENLEQELATLKEDTKDFDSIKLKAENYEQSLAKFREEVIGTYNLAKGEAVDETMLTLLADCDEKVLRTMHSQFTKEVELKFPTSCSDCGSTNLSKRSSEEGDGGDGKDGKGGKDKAILSNAEAKKILLERKKSKS